MTLLDACELIVDCPHSTAPDEGAGYPLIRTPNIGKGRLLLEGVHRVSEETYNKRNERAIPQEGDLILAREAPVGNVAKIQSGQKVCLGQRTVLIRPKKNIDSDFLTYYLLSPYIQHMLLVSSNGATVSHLNMAAIRKLTIDLPDLSTQRRIGSLLSAIDNKIEINIIINENLLQQLHQMYLHIFGTSDMDILLGTVINTTSGGTPSRKHDEYYSNSSICWVKSKELLSGYIHDTEEHINELAVEKSSAKLLPTHSVLIAMYGATVGAYGIIAKPMTCNQAVCALLSNESYPYTYLFQLACESQQKLINLAVGSAQQNISQVLIKQLPVHRDLEAIQRFHSLAKPIHEEIELLQAENVRLATIRDSLLPRLMSGELDVSGLDL